MTTDGRLAHREMFPEQYSHPLVGKRVRIKDQDLEGTVTRVVSSRFGQLAILDDQTAEFAYLVSYCEVIDEKENCKDCQ